MNCLKERSTIDEAWQERIKQILTDTLEICDSGDDAGVRRREMPVNVASQMMYQVKKANVEEERVIGVAV